MDWKPYLAAALAMIGFLFSAGQWFGRVNERLDRLERQQDYLHGTFRVPEGTR